MQPHCEDGAGRGEVRTRLDLHRRVEERVAREVILLDVPVLEQQLLGLVWRGGKIDHPHGEHDGWANAAAGVVAALRRARAKLQIYAA